MAIDPYRVLGLPPGSSAAEVKRAYRRLAKANHPDSAGAAALPRFLEIQRAYETLTTTVWRPGMRRPAPTTPTEPWRADSSRARSTAGADGSRPRSTPGARPAGEAGGAARSGAGRAHRAPGTDGAAAGPSRGGAAGKGARTDGRGRTEGPAGRRKPSKKATFGSTTYDEAKEGADTAWSGASWYGPSSGEYWRVNPREYADPRKHGPEYLAKAAARAAAAAERRARQEEASGDPSAGAPDRRRRPATASRDWSSQDDRARGAAAADPFEAAARGDEAAWTSTHARGAWQGQAPRPSEATSAAGRADGGGWAGAGWGLSLPSINPGPGLRRLLRALIAWPPLGIAAAALIGEATGCAGFEATCAAPADLYPWAAQAGIIVALLALPSVARILAGGTLAVVLLAFPVAAVLSASGATYDRTYGPAALMAVLAIAWAVGVGAVLMRRAVTRAIP